VSGAGTPLIIGATQRAALAMLRARAAADPVDVRSLMSRLATPEGKRAHRDRMTALTVDIPAAYLVTFSIETGHPGGTARHMSMSINRGSRAPNQFAVWMVCAELGFVGDLDACTVWPEELQRGPDPGDRHIAVNVVQIIAPGGAGRA
jgi:hypothetical protein